MLIKYTVYFIQAVIGSSATTKIINRISSALSAFRPHFKPVNHIFFSALFKQTSEICCHETLQQRRSLLGYKKIQTKQT